MKKDYSDIAFIILDPKKALFAMNEACFSMPKKLQFGVTARETSPISDYNSKMNLTH